MSRHFTSNVIIKPTRIPLPNSMLNSIQNDFYLSIVIINVSWKLLNWIYKMFQHWRFYISIYIYIPRFQCMLFGWNIKYCNVVIGIHSNWMYKIADSPHSTWSPFPVGPVATRIENLMIGAPQASQVFLWNVPSCTELFHGLPSSKLT